MGKRGQVTVFIITGVAILFILFFVFSMISKIKNAELKQEAEDIVDNMLSKSSIESYVTSCLQTVARDGIRKLSTQGGRLYNYQLNYAGPETIPHYEYHDPNLDYDFNISYMIRIEDNDLPFFYPCPMSPEHDSSCGVSDMSFTAEEYLRVACRFKYSESFSGHGDCKFGLWSLPRADLAFDENSLKNQLENYIENNILSCIDFDFFNNTEGRTIESGELDVEALFSYNDVRINFELPLGINMSNGFNYVTTTYYASLPTRIKTLYERLFYVRDSELTLETTDPGNDLVNGIEKYVLKRGLGFRPRIIEDVHFNDDILVIEDEKQTYSGMPDLYMFMIENRPPALSFINNSDDGNYDIRISSSDGVMINPNAVDPDDDRLLYIYRGWNADYNCSVENDPVSGNDLCNRVELSEPGFRNANDHSLAYDSSDGHAFIMPDPEAASCLQILENNPLSGGDCPVVFDDSGNAYYNTSLMVYDGELYDYQDILIEIEDDVIKPLPEIKPAYEYVFDVTTQNLLDPGIGSGMFDNVQTIVSLEDPYKLIHKGDSIMGGSNLGWILPNFNHDPLLYPQAKFNTTYMCTLLPTKEQCIETGGDYDINILNIKEMMTPGMTYYFIDTLVHGDIYGHIKNNNPYSEPWVEVTLATNPDSGSQETENYRVALVPCMPHRSEFLSYPYNPSAIDPYLANHTCCTSSFEYADTDTVCYSEDAWFCGTGDNDPDNNMINDIVHVDRIQKCSGTRGNVCDGDTADVVIESVACGDKGISDDARCSGCTDDPAFFKKEISEFSGCVFFSPGDNFEKDVMEITSSPYCNDYPECSSGEGKGHYAKGGPLSCKAYCNGEGGCDFATECVCSASCGASPQCDGLSPGDMTGTCSFGSPELADVCSDNCIIEDGTIFSYNPPACDSVDPMCDGKSNGDPVFSCGGGVQDFFSDVCDEDGTLADDPNHVCMSNGGGFSDCTGSSVCAGYSPGTVITNSGSCYVDEWGSVTNFAIMCDSECQPEESTMCLKCPGNDVDYVCNYKRPGTDFACGEHEPYKRASFRCDDDCQVGDYVCRANPCGAPEICDGIPPDTPIDADGIGGIESICRADCYHMDCSPYNYAVDKYNPYTGTDGACYDKSDFSDDTYGMTDEEKASVLCNDPSLGLDYGVLGNPECADT
ncbi:MAG: hypothetical protein ACLFPQ_01055 [Candidatus Woesearchaeota archaeon]